MDSVEPEPRAEWNPDLSGARADFLHAARSANEQQKRCPSISQTAYLGLGSNLGDRLRSLRAAIHALDRHHAVKVDWDAGIAPVYETSAVGGPPDQPPYLNSAIRIFTTLDPFELLAATQHIENQLGRKRPERWAARTIDIDILLFGDERIKSEALTIPHPRMHERLFVLAPLGDVAPDVTHPGIGSAVQAIAKQLATSEAGKSIVRLIERDWCHQPTVGALPKSE